MLTMPSQSTIKARTIQRIHGHKEDRRILGRGLPTLQSGLGLIDRSSTQALSPSIGRSQVLGVPEINRARHSQVKGLVHTHILPNRLGEASRMRNLRVHSMDIQPHLKDLCALYGLVAATKDCWSLMKSVSGKPYQLESHC